MITSLVIITTNYNVIEGLFKHYHWLWCRELRKVKHINQKHCRKEGTVIISVNVNKWLMIAWKPSKRCPVLENKFTSCCGCDFENRFSKEQWRKNIMITWWFLQIPCEYNGVWHPDIHLENQETKWFKNKTKKKERESISTTKPKTAKTQAFMNHYS